MNILFIYIFMKRYNIRYLYCFTTNRSPAASRSLGPHLDNEHLLYIDVFPFSNHRVTSSAPLFVPKLELFFSKESRRVVDQNIPIYESLPSVIPK